ncbi:cation transporter [Mucilaginibacter rubeus]|uniref:Cation transporter n=1 Tax=Mucilaginibacter rubeus TaxID=2027860 RepID=A0AAE6JCG2_9SPHI|nr:MULTISPECIES: cation transporter [Mucilaginibacter]QEM03040.1 cation transporter [Mucilaginibacter rubeus]QEM15659.1 cation transporter [Mucilaginibacter gossypii]QTE41607.1 cation transporter [Mucilaginibacter rubeus]QTE48212.1 cation transporter [Mucilaginibacter rubeus]QTE59601.1 cation transporter [Mucilaginibacter rubeus]
MASSLLRQGKILEYITLTWNIIGVIVLLLVAAPAVHSVALIGFGFDTLLEIGASTIVIWELNGTGGNRQRKGLRLLSIAFFILGIYILVQSLWNLINHTHSGPSSLGMIWLTLTFIVMVILALKKKQVGNLLSNPVLLTEGRVTLVDAALAGIVLISMLLNLWLNWWWADIAGGFLLMGYCFWEAIHAWKESRI